MSADLYHSRVLELASEIPNLAPLDAPQGGARKTSRICGSTVFVQVRLDADRISAFSIDPRACALGQAAASVLSRNIIGAHIDEVRCARDELAAMLKAGGPPPQGRFWELRHLEGVRDYPARHASTLLAFDAALEAIEAAQAARQGPSSGSLRPA